MFEASFQNAIACISSMGTFWLGRGGGDDGRSFCCALSLCTASASWLMQDSKMRAIVSRQLHRDLALAPPSLGVSGRHTKFSPDWCFGLSEDGSRLFR